MKTNIFLLLFLTLLVASCIKDTPPDPPPTLPPITKEGKNTIGFLLNGGLWLPEVPFPDFTGSIYISCGLSRNTRYLVVNTTRYISIRDFVNPAIDSVRQMLRFGIKNIISTGNYSFDRPGDIFTDLAGQCSDHDITYPLDQNTPSQFKVDYFNETERIISGTFFMDVVNLTCKDTLRIRDGRFDLKFNWVE